MQKYQVESKSYWRRYSSEPIRKTHVVEDMRQISSRNRTLSMDPNAWKMCFKCTCISLGCIWKMTSWHRYVKQSSCVNRNVNTFGFFLGELNLWNIDHVVLWWKHLVAVFRSAKFREASFLGLVLIIWTSVRVKFRKPSQRLVGKFPDSLMLYRMWCETRGRCHLPCFCPPTAAVNLQLFPRS